MNINEIVGKIIEEVVYAIFNAEIELEDPTQTIKQVKAFIETIEI